MLLLLIVAQPARALTLTLEWDEPDDETVVGYIVAYGTAPGSYPSEIDVGEATSSRISGLDPATTYYFIVQSYNSAHVRSSPSNEAVYQPFSITCRATTASSPDGGPVAVTLNPPIVVGETPPLTTTCAPSSGSLFAVGSTPVVCTATDATGSVSCQSFVTVTYTPPDSGGSPPGDSGDTGPTYEIPPPPGSYGFNDHGYYRPDGGWQETRRLSSGRSTSWGCSPGTPTYEIPPPPGSYGFSDHGYYAPQGGWVETRRTGGGSAGSCGWSVVVGPSAGSYQVPPPPGSWGFSDHGYYRPDGGWQETPRVDASRRALMTGTSSSTGRTSAGTVRATGADASSAPDRWRNVAPPASVAVNALPQAAPHRAATAASIPGTSGTSGTSGALGTTGVQGATGASGRSKASSTGGPQVTPIPPEPRPTATVTVPTLLTRGPVKAKPPPLPDDLNPGMPEVVAPNNHATGVGREMNLTWTAVSSVLMTGVTYDVYIGDSPAPPIATIGLSQPAARVQNLAPSTTYYWRVVAHNGAGDAESDTWSFTTAAGSTQDK